MRLFFLNQPFLFASETTPRTILNSTRPSPSGDVVEWRTLEKSVIVEVAEVIVYDYKSGRAQVPHNCLALPRHGDRRPEVYGGVESSSAMIRSNSRGEYIEDVRPPGHSTRGLMMSPSGVVLLHFGFQPRRVVRHHEHVSVLRHEHPRGVEEVLQRDSSERHLFVATHVHPLSV